MKHNGTVRATREKHKKEKSTAMSSQTAYTAASSGGQKKKERKKKKNYSDIDVYAPPQSYNRLFVEEGLGHNGTVRATRRKTQGEEHGDVFTDSIHCGIVRRPKKEEEKKKKKKELLRYIYVYVPPPSYNSLFIEEGLGHNGTVRATREKNTKRRRSIDKQQKQQQHYSDIDMPYTYVSSST